MTTFSGFCMKDVFINTWSLQPVSDNKLFKQTLTGKWTFSRPDPHITVLVIVTISIPRFQVKIYIAQILY